MYATAALGLDGGVMITESPNPPRIAGLARVLFAIGSASLAAWSLAYGDFLPWGGQPVLAGIPWRHAWVYGSALIILAASAGLCFPRTALAGAGALTIGAYQAIGAAVSVPQIFSDPLSVGAWYPFFESLTPLAAAWILYAMLRRQSQASVKRMAGKGAVRAAQVLFGVSCVFYGWSHFAYADYTASMVPTWLPGPLSFAYLTGLGHVAAGVAVVVGLLPRLAATVEAIMMGLFGLLVWVPSFFAQPRPQWATPPEQQWSELVVTLLLAASAWIVAISFANRPWTFSSRSHA